MNYLEQLLRDDIGGRPATAADAKRLVKAGGIQIGDLDTTIMASRASRPFKKAWRDFAHGWRMFFGESASYAARIVHAKAAMYRQNANEWRRAFDQELRAHEMGALVLTPGAIFAEMKTVDAAIKQLDSDIMASKARDAFKQAWRAFAVEWQAFFKSHSRWTDRLWGASYEKTLDYRKRVGEWRVAFEREGGQPSAPGLAMPGAPGGGGTSWKTALVAVGGLLVVGAIVGHKVSATR